MHRESEVRVTRDDVGLGCGALVWYKAREHQTSLPSQRDKRVWCSCTFQGASAEKKTSHQIENQHGHRNPRSGLATVRSYPLLRGTLIASYLRIFFAAVSHDDCTNNSIGSSIDSSIERILRTALYVRTHGCVVFLASRVKQRAPNPSSQRTCTTTEPKKKPGVGGGGGAHVVGYRVFLTAS